MIDLHQQVDPYNLELPYGLTVTVEPLTTAGMAAAQAAARRSVEAIERQRRERTEAGLQLEGLPDLSTEAERDGFYQAQLIRELAVRHIESWTGIDLDGGPAPPTPENIAAVMEIYPVRERFFQEFTLRQVLLNAAKSGSGLSAALPTRSDRSCHHVKEHLRSSWGGQAQRTQLHETSLIPFIEVLIKRTHDRSHCDQA
jgi:hypothetical protein